LAEISGRQQRSNIIEVVRIPNITIAFRTPIICRIILVIVVIVIVCFGSVNPLINCRNGLLKAEGPLNSISRVKLTIDNSYT
jgi:hypothetical protein